MDSQAQIRKPASMADVPTRSAWDARRSHRRSGNPWISRQRSPSLSYAKNRTARVAMQLRKERAKFLFCLRGRADRMARLLDRQLAATLPKTAHLLGDRIGRNTERRSHG